MQADQQLLNALAKIDPTKPYGTELFDAIARLWVTPAVEAVCLRWNQEAGRVEVYLVQRSPNDTAYPDEWHCPGTALRPGQEISDAFARLVKKEFGGKISSYHFVTNIAPSKLEPEVRGTFLSMVYLCIFEGKEGLRSKWFPVDDLPANTVKHHRERVIPCALGAFVAQNPRVCK